jgi:LmbE family N-acetylglucosaminyl deacetylase
MKTSRLLIVIVTAIVLSQCNTNPQTKPADTSPKTLLAIFAHPDDEATVSPVLAKYAAEGVNVYLCIATDGRLGITDHAKIPAGDSLAAVRKQELLCATEKLGINPPIMFGLEDQLKMSEGMNAFNAQMDSVRNGVRKLFIELKPDVVITWNASGWTGHHDHRLVSAAVTEVFESQKWDKPTQLYYSAIPTGNMPEGSPMSLATVDKSFLTVTIPVSEADYAKSKESWLCHKSQYTPEMIEGMHQMIKGAMQNKWYFRPHSGNPTPKQTLF